MDFSVSAAISYCDHNISINREIIKQNSKQAAVDTVEFTVLSRLRLVCDRNFPVLPCCIV